MADIGWGIQPRRAPAAVKFHLLPPGFCCALWIYLSFENTDYTFLELSFDICIRDHVWILIDQVTNILCPHVFDRREKSLPVIKRKILGNLVDFAASELHLQV